MIGTSRDSFAESKKINRYVGVATISIVGINPNNEMLKKNGWNIADDAAEPVYVYEKDKKKSARVRFLVRLEDIPETPVIPLDFWVGPEYQLNSEGTKCKVIDKYCQTAWVTKEEYKNHVVPQWKNGPANVCADYKMCHRGEEELLCFLLKFVNMPPYLTYDKENKKWDVFSLEGFLTIDHWDRLVAGNVAEIREIVAQKPNNKMKIMLGVKLTDDNKSVQTFATGGLMDKVYYGENAAINSQTGEYYAAAGFVSARAKRAEESGKADNYVYSAAPVHIWDPDVKPTEVKQNEEVSTDIPDFESDAFTKEPVDDLPFD